MLCLVCTQATAALPAPGTPGAPASARYCGEPARYADGSIKRSKAALKAFMKAEPCPATLDPADTSCKGWQVQHLWPLASGGCDAAHNMYWLPDSIKSCARPECVDRWERKYYSTPRQKISLE